MEQDQSDLTKPKKPRFQNWIKIQQKLKTIDQFPLRILNKILANQIKVLNKETQHNQVNFISGIQYWFDICKSINIIYYKLKDRNQKIISRNAEKTFEDAQH